MACRLAASSTISTRGRWRPRCASGRCFEWIKDEMTTRNIHLLFTTACVCAMALLAHEAAAYAQAPKPIKDGEVLSGELRVMRSRVKGKRVNTYQVVSTQGRRIPGEDGLCNLET